MTPGVKFARVAEEGEVVAPSRSTSELRTDARRNAAQILAAARNVFGEHGFSAPLEDVAVAAGVSKATIFNRFGGRVGLIEAVIEDVVAAESQRIIEHTRSIPDVAERIDHYLGAIRDLQYRRPAVNDVLLQEYPHSEQLLAICHAAGEIYDELVEAGHAAGVLAPEFTREDLHALIVDNALALKHGSRPPRADYDRRTGFILGGIRRPAR
ncbi:TetR/AcrR family transcriptional regulator [Prauserella cavernicola]|uniref:TetR/AcrR family transcriptional regulator n=1 Tax=Prauserella cavernicola TaxID=2800127 RepID=A0A934QPM6_9PSEU|nr:TetR/AcrR family transcriptional regulator [Prauserella cavernicola]MBK1783738.1 TetR/AcrR family transcriptional regulator [Prauserella cavernicola]